MLRNPIPKSAGQRLREFRERNPGYDRRYMARSRAATAAAVAQQRAELAAALAVEPVLMLPAPVQDLMTAEVAALAAKLRAGSSADALEPVSARLAR